MVFAGARAHRDLDGASPQSVFDTVEALALTSLPRNEFELTVWFSWKVGVECHINIKGRLYSVPLRLIGQQFHARTASAHVQILHQSKVVATHALLLKLFRANDFEHYPPEKIAFHIRRPTWCR